MCLNSREGGLAVKRIEGSKTNASLNTLSAGETTSSTWDTWELKRLSSNVWRRKIGIGACVSQHSYRKLSFRIGRSSEKHKRTLLQGKSCCSPSSVKFCGVTIESGDFHYRVWRSQEVLGETDGEAAVVTIDVIDPCRHQLPLGMFNTTERNFQSQRKNEL